MEPIFLSYFLSESTPTYGGAERTIIFEQERSIERGDTSNNLKFIFPAHVGTHIDFPRHFSVDGKVCNEYPAAFWMFSKVGFIECQTWTDRESELFGGDTRGGLGAFASVGGSGECGGGDVSVGQWGGGKGNGGVRPANARLCGGQRAQGRGISACLGAELIFAQQSYRERWLQ